MAILFAGILFLITSATTIFSIIPNALNRFDISNKVGLVTITLQQVSIAIAVLNSATIPQIFLISSIMAFISSCLNMYISHRLLPNLSLYYLCIDKKEILNFYKFGISSFVNNIASSSLTYLDRIIIPFLLGPSNLTYYSLPGNVASKTSGFANVMSSTLFPLTTHLDSTNNIEKIKLLYVRSTRLLFILSASIVITIVSFSYEILNYWINNDLAEKASGILIILAITNLILSSTSPISNILLGIGKLKYLTINSIIMATLNILLIFILAPKFGLTGIAWAYLLSLLPMIWLIFKIEREYLKLESRFNFYILILSKVSIVSLIIYTINDFLLRDLVKSLFTLLIVLPLSIILFLALYFFFGFFDKKDIHDIKKFLKST
jgi:O-antigen/teichoic acid export membrane protein